MAQLDIESRLEAVAPIVLSVFRIVVGFLFACHGSAILFGWPLAMPGGTPAIGTWPDWYAGVIELLVGLLVGTGLATRMAALIGSGEMAFAYFTVHQPTAPLPIANNGELSVLFCFSFFLLIFTGGGIIALDSLRRR